MFTRLQNSSAKSAMPDVPIRLGQQKADSPAPLLWSDRLGTREIGASLVKGGELNSERELGWLMVSGFTT